MSIFSLVVLAVVYSHMFGMRQDELVNSKLGASDQSRRGFDLLARDIRSCKSWQVGNGNDSTFTAIPNGTLQKGNAVRISMTLATNTFTYYNFVVNPTNDAYSELHRRKTSVSGYKVIAKGLTNNMYFQSEDYRGTIVQSNLLHNMVLHTWMEFAQYQYPLTKVGPSHYYDYYKMEFRLTSHQPD